MADVFTQAKRSEVMARIRSRGNRDTEGALAGLFRRHGITGWRRHSEVRRQKAEGRCFRVRPDFVFPKLRLAVFVDGCFWHGCPRHSPPARWLRKSAMAAAPERRADTTRTGKRYWRVKLAANRARDRAVNRALRAAGWRLLRVWEHDLTRPRQARLLARLCQALGARSGPAESAPGGAPPPLRRAGCAPAFAPQRARRAGFRARSSGVFRRHSTGEGTGFTPSHPCSD